ncbi:hypothetical protein C0992_004789 [Termitomyces sp. T32_za158]|nr:hypothetical protein C0992_004789 [Termitomyces sp. T32_za158]
MALNPQAQAKAQKEIDDVVGLDRLPDFRDRESLVFFDCVFKESLRWGTPAPLYPKSFKPERFEGLDPKEAKRLDPTNYVYGFGRRRCPGNHFADSAVWFSMVGLLSAFDILPALDENGKEIPIREEFEAGAIRHPKPFRVRFTPRHANSLELLAFSK